jgi:pyruvate formate lyase activating enzyme
MGIIFDIQRFSVHDGPGIRTTVFFKGCNLHCIWCHNPESFSPEKQLSYKKSACIFCGECIKVCPCNVHFISEKTHTVDFSSCIACGKCTGVCVMNALKIIGCEVSPEEIMRDVLKDKKFYDASGGGLTVSGGEPTFQYEFLVQLLLLAKQNNIHTCIETNGSLPAGKLKDLLPLVDLFLVDYKHWNPQEHHKYTGAELNSVLNSLDLLNTYKKPVILRCPIIPGINDNEIHFKTIMELKRENRNIIEIEQMPYHETGKEKWEQIGLKYCR